MSASEELGGVVPARSGGQDTWPDIDQLVILRHAHHTHFKSGGSWGSLSLHPWLPSEEDPAYCPACDPNVDSGPCIPESSSCLLPAEASLGHLGAAQKLLAGRQRPGTQLRETQYWLCIFCFISLFINIIVIISVIIKTFYIQFVSLSPFSSFSLSLVGGWGLIESACHSFYWNSALNCYNSSEPTLFLFFSLSTVVSSSLYLFVFLIT